jgi:hypothetical protein
VTTEFDTSCRKQPDLYRSHKPWRETNRRAQCEEIRTLRSMWRGLDTWQGRDVVTLALPKGRETGNTNFDLHRRASPRPYRNNNCRSRPDCYTGKAADDGDRRANKLHWTCRGNGDGMQAEETRRNTGNPRGDRCRDQPVTRERWTGSCGVAERFAVPVKPGNSGGGKGPQLKTNARSNEGPRDWR